MKKTHQETSPILHFEALESAEKRASADAIVLPFWKKGGNPQPAFADFRHWQSILEGPLHSKDFQAKEGEALLLYPSHQPEKRMILIGLGEQEKITTEQLRRTYGSLVKVCNNKKIASLHLMLPEVKGLDEKGMIRGVAEGLLLANYAFNKYRLEANKESASSFLKKVAFFHIKKPLLVLAQKYATVCEGVFLARDLVNDNADVVNPQYLAQLARKWAQQLPRVKTTVFDKKRIEKEKMGLLLAVNRGSSLEPAFIIMEYRGNPKSKDHTVIIGKGITYDTGGLNLKPGPSMETMKCDMGGAATAFGTLYAAASCGLKVNFTVVVPSTENSISSTSYKPGDVYTSLSGKTVEISDTDAEGRLVLADAITYACRHLRPTRIIDFATLTGGVGIALGWEASGLMSTDDALADGLIRASSETFERVWRLPLWEEYAPLLKSDIADMKNSGGRFPSSILGGMFLKEFVEDRIPWAHLDIAYTAFLNDPKRYLPKYATGVGVRLMIEFFEHMETS